jgi:hypothetical protein
MNDTNLLFKIPGQYISAGSRSLPSAETATDDPQQAVVDVPGIGRVRLTYTRFKHKKAKTTRFFWTVESAELIGDQ